MTLAEFCGVEEVPMIRESIPALLDKYKDVFEWLEELPLRRSIEHHIHLKKGTDSVNARSYKYAYQQEEVDEILASGVIRPST